MRRFSKVIQDRKEKAVDFRRRCKDLLKKNCKPLPRIPNPFMNLPEEHKLIILVDIVGFSKGSTKEQLFDIYLFQRYLTERMFSGRIEGIKIRHFIPTGDGCYILAEECSADAALDFLVSLVSDSCALVSGGGNSLSLRASALFGSCVKFFDIAHRLNYLGEGMNEAERILSAGQNALEEHYIKSVQPQNPDSGDKKLFSRSCIYLDNSVVSGIGRFKDRFPVFSFKDVPDKHGKKRDITVLKLNPQIPAS